MKDGSVEMIVEVKRKKNNGAVWLDKHMDYIRDGETKSAEENRL